MIFWQLILYTFSAWMFYSLLAVGFGLVLRSVKFFNIAYGGAFLVGGYMMFFLYRSLTIAFLPALFLSLLASGFYMLLTYQFIFKTILHRGAKNFVLLITSFGILVATAAAIGIIFGSQTTLVARKLSDVFTVNVFGAVLNIAQVVTMIGAPIVVCCIAYVIFKTRFGKAVRAVEDDSEVAALVGIPKEKIILQLFFLSGVFAGAVGIVAALDVGIVPSAGLFYILPTIIVVIVGGIRSFWGGILGALVLAAAQELTAFFIGGSWVQAVPFVILIAVLLFRPEGILKK